MIPTRCPLPQVKRGLDAPALHRVNRLFVNGIKSSADRSLAINRRAEPVQHAAEQFITRLDISLTSPRNNPGTRPDTGDIAERHKQNFVVPESYYFRFNISIRTNAALLDLADFSNIGSWPKTFNNQTNPFVDAAIDLDRIGFTDKFTALSY
jgi:hypothetical protein